MKNLIVLLANKPTSRPNKTFVQIVSAGRARYDVALSIYSDVDIEQIRIVDACWHLRNRNLPNAIQSSRFNRIVAIDFRCTEAKGHLEHAMYPIAIRPARRGRAVVFGNIADLRR